MEIGSHHHGFIIKDIIEIPEYKSRGILAVHQATGAEVFHTLNDDQENLFAYMFKTIPESSNGVAHILEHTVLCGSQRYPVKDPFLLLLKGSMQTFLNALTYPDKTLYPASSTVKEDLFNLMDVYGDAVFFPLLKEDLFRQEGHRLELDEKGQLIRTGIVYNEMKGNYSTHDSVAGDWCYRSLLPDTPYSVDSGGDPKVIPELTYEDFVHFHKTYYHPSNCQVFLYGDIPTEEYLSFLDQRFFSKFSSGQQAPAITLQPRWKEPRYLEVPYPSGEGDKEETHSSVTLNWLLSPIEEVETTLAWEVLTEILMGTPASPLQKLAAQTELGEDLSAPSGYETELRQTVFSLGLQGADRAKKLEIEQLFLDELERIVHDGFHEDLIEGVIRRFEFRNKEIKGGGPFGLRLLRKIARGWLHHLNPTQTLAFDRPMKELRQKLEQNPSYFQQLVREHLLDNPHRTLVVVYPDSDQNRRESELEHQQLQELAASQPKEFLETVKQEQQALLAFQSEEDSPEDIAKIPFLKVSQIPQQVDKIETKQKSDYLFIHDLYTNDITYVDLIFPFDHLSAEEQLLLPLWTSFIPQAGLQGKDYEMVSRELGMKAGGFVAQPEVHAALDLFSGAKDLQKTSSHRSDRPMVRHIHLRIKALDRTFLEGMDLVQSLIYQPDFFDLTHLNEVFFELRNDFRSSILPAGSSYAIMRAEMGLHPAQDVEERLRGLTQFLFLEQVAQSIHQDRGKKVQSTLEQLAHSLTLLTKKITQGVRLLVNCTAQGEGLAQAIVHLEKFVSNHFETYRSDQSIKIGCFDRSSSLEQSAQKTLLAASADMSNPWELLQYPSKVSYAGLAFESAVLGTPEQAQEALLAHLLKTGPLWEEIRMKGGAYGAHAASDGMAGIFSFASYRDPNTLRTFDSFKSSLEQFANIQVSIRDLDLAKIGSISKEMKPLSPGEKGLIGFKRTLYGITDHLRQRRRDLMLGLTPNQISEGASRLLSNINGGRKTLLAGDEILAEVSKKLDPAPSLIQIGR
jgi:Zn-dependent M16 (insulinase) family peptidase